MLLKERFLKYSLVLKLFTVELHVMVVEHSLLQESDINVQNVLILIFVKNAKLLLSMSMSSLKSKKKERGIKNALKTHLDIIKDNLVITVIIMAIEDSGKDLNIDKRKEAGN